MSTNSLIGLLTYMIPFTALCLVTGITIHIRNMEENDER
jgi:hypothetical protein